MRYGFKEWVKAALVRAIKTAAQAAIGGIGAAVVIEDVAWVYVAGAAGLAAVVSLLTSLAGLPEVDNGANVREIVKQDNAN